MTIAQAHVPSRRLSGEIVTPLLFAAAIFVGWELAVIVFEIPLYIVPPPSLIV